jgi:hypothetical protein
MTVQAFVSVLEAYSDKIGTGNCANTVHDLCLVVTNNIEGLYESGVSELALSTDENLSARQATIGKRVLRFNPLG